jgi:RNA polymerase sigma-70 factor (ECF subfamily)
VNELDALFEAVRGGDPLAFAEWMGRVERPIRRSLARFARAVDVEGIVQETLMRMWVLATQGGRELEGENASLRFAIGVARNLARSEARRLGRERHAPLDDLPDPPAPPEPLRDHGLRRLIRECMERIANRPRAALSARIRHQDEIPDHTIAEQIGMTLNAFHQNIVRARKQMADCLRARQVPLEEVSR